MVDLLILVGFGGVVFWVYKFGNSSGSRNKQDILSNLLNSNPAPCRQYPLLTNEMVQPIGNKITTQEAKRLYREFMVEIGYLERDEVALAIESLTEAIKDETAFLQEEYTNAIEDLKEARKHDTAGEVEWAEREVQKTKERLAAFKADKRAWLIDYINMETQTH